MRGAELSFWAKGLSAGLAQQVIARVVELDELPNTKSNSNVWFLVEEVSEDGFTLGFGQYIWNEMSLETVAKGQNL